MGCAGPQWVGEGGRGGRRCTWSQKSVSSLLGFLNIGCLHFNNDLFKMSMKSFWSRGQLLNQLAPSQDFSAWVWVCAHDLPRDQQSLKGTVLLFLYYSSPPPHPQFGFLRFSYVQWTSVWKQMTWPIVRRAQSTVYITMPTTTFPSLHLNT